MSITVNRLEWDSGFFNLSVLAAYQVSLGSNDLEKLIQAMDHCQADLAYFYTSEPLAGDCPHGYELVAADRKTTYSKSVTGNSRPDEHISPYISDEPDSALLMLAIESGHLSRFRVDPNFSKAQFEGLYATWIEHLVPPSPDRQVLVYENDGQTTGLITIEKKDFEARIGLFAVHPAHRKRGIGSALLQAAETWSVKQGAIRLDVVTQAANITACSLYEQFGFRLVQLEHIYHLWKKTDKK